MYKLTQSGYIIRTADGAIIPVDFLNTDYQEYQRWLEEGNVTEPADPPPPVAPLAQIEALEQMQIKRTARAIREERLKEMEAFALANYGLNQEQLYVAASAPNAPTAMKSYKELKDLDNQIAALRAQL